MKRLIAGLLALALSLAVTGRAQAAQVLYGATGSGGALSTLYTINPLTGAGTAIGPVGYSITGLAFDPTTGILYGGTSRGSGTHGLITINPLTGAGTFVGLYGTGFESMADITFDASGQLYGFLEPSSDDLYRINKATGAATLVGNSPGSAVTGLAFDNSGVLYQEAAGNLFILNPVTGLATTYVGYGGRVVGMGMDFDASNTLYALERLGGGATGARNLVTINLTNGAATTVGSTIAGLDALAFAPAAVPEPTTLALLCVSSLGFVGYRRRQRTAA